MGKIILHENITPEGYCDHRAFVADTELMQSVNELLGTVDKALFGRSTFQLFENYWPSVWQNKNAPDPDVEFAGLMENIEKIVISRTIKNSSWQNTRILQKLNPSEIRSLKEMSEHNMIVFGSLNLATQLIRLGLIDEYYFIVQPMIYGSGGRLFNNGGLDEHQYLKLIDTKIYRSGAVSIHYQIGK
jgi:dihydrofolate reductase